MKVVQIDGGIGRVLASTGAIRKLAERTGEKVIVISSWPEVFWFNPHVYKVYGMGREWLFDDVIKNNDFICPEPYHDMRYYTQKHHLSQSFDYILNGEEEFMYPEVFMSHEENKWAKELTDTIRTTSQRRFLVAFQPFGAGFSKDVPDGTNRSLSFDDAFYLAENAGQSMFLNCSHIDMDHVSVWRRQFTTRELITVVSNCDAVISVDSSSIHSGAAFKKKGVVLMGGTYEKNVSYPDLYKSIYREGYPKSYFANRFHGFVDQNAGAMSFSRQELDEAIIQLNNVLLEGEHNGTFPTCNACVQPSFFKVDGCTGTR